MEMNIDVSERFASFLTDWDYKQYLLIGGYGSGKSYNIALKIILKLMQEKRTALVVRNVMATIKEIQRSRNWGVRPTSDVIVDGHISDYEMKVTGKTKEWISGEMKKRRIVDIGDIFLMTVDDKENTVVIRKEEK